jgi:hypothetical protein
MSQLLFSLETVSFGFARTHESPRSRWGFENLDHAVGALLPAPQGSPIAFYKNADVAIAEANNAVIQDSVSRTRMLSDGSRFAKVCKIEELSPWLRYAPLY